MATLRVMRSLASACRRARLSARCPIETAAVEYPAAIAARACRTSAADRSRSLRAPMTFRRGSRTFWFFVMVVGAAFEPVGEPVVGGLADGVVGVAGFGGDAGVELGVQVAEFVDDGGFGGAADFPAGAFPVAGVAGGELAAPEAGAGAVALGVAAGAAVFEGDAVFATPAPGSHGDSLTGGGDIQW